MSPRLRLLALGLATTLASCRPTQRDVNFAGLEYGKRTLDLRNDIKILELTNGMRVAMIPDDRTNLVSVDVRYRVGASQDPADRAGLAHLIEHLTFEVPADSQGGTIFEKLEAIALSFNAYTSYDVTHYTATALANRVDALLEMEARRLETPCSKVPDEAFIRERDVVLQEEAQRTTAWTPIRAAIDARVWGAAHPYARRVGDRAVGAATKAEACAFFDAHYTPSNALLIVTGNIKPDRLEPRIGRRFGTIVRATAAPPRATPAPAALSGQSEHVGDVARPTAQIYLPTPPWGDERAALHDLLVRAVSVELARLDERESWIVDTGIGYVGDHLQRATIIALTVDDPARLEQAVTRAMELGRQVLSEGDDLARARTFAVLRGAQQTRTVETSDQFDDKGSLVADYLTFTSDLQFWFARMRATDAIGVPELQRYAQTVFRREASHVALIRPSGTAGVGGAEHVAGVGRDYDLPTWRSPVDPDDATRPEVLPPAPPPLRLYQDRLPNGLHVVMYVAPRSPTFEARLIFPRGSIDEPAGQRGVATLAAYLLGPDSERLYPRGIADLLNWALTSVGTQLDTRVDEESTTFKSRGLAMFADWHVWRLAWLIDQGVYEDDTLASFRRDLREETERAASPSARAYLERLYGVGHPYATVAAGRDAFLRLSTDQLDAWRTRAFGTDGATLVMSGAFDPDEMIDHVRALFAELPRRTAPTRATPPAPAPAAGPSWIGTRLASEQQVRLYVAFTAASDPVTDGPARAVLEAMIADRLRVVREGMGATYGVSTKYLGGAAGWNLEITAALDPDRAPRAAAAVLAELTSLRRDPTTMAADFVRARRRLVTTSLATSADAAAVEARLAEAIARGADLKALSGRAASLAAVTLAEVAAVAARDLDPARMVVSVDGREAPVTATLDALGAKDVSWFDE